MLRDCTLTEDKGLIDIKLPVLDSPFEANDVMSNESELALEIVLE